MYVFEFWDFFKPCSKRLIESLLILGFLGKLKKNNRLNKIIIMKTLFTTIIFLLFIYLGMDDVSIWVLLFTIALSQVFPYEKFFSFYLYIGISLFSSYYIYLFDNSSILQNLFFFLLSFILWIIYSQFQSGSISIGSMSFIIPNKIIAFFDREETIGEYLIAFLLLSIMVYLSSPYLVEVFFKTSDFVVEKTFFSLALLYFSLNWNYFFSEDFKNIFEDFKENKLTDTNVLSGLSQKINMENIKPLFEGLNFIQVITMITLIASISINSREYINNFWDNFYNLFAIIKIKSPNIISEIVRIINEILILIFY